MRVPNQLDEKARELGYHGYDHYTKKSDYWYVFGQQYRGKRCYCCKEARAYSSYFVLHHISYERLGQELPEDVVTVCPRCHERCHELIWQDLAELKNAHHVLAAMLRAHEKQMLLPFEQSPKKVA